MCGVEKGHEIITKKYWPLKFLMVLLLNGWSEIGNKLGYVLSHEDVNIVMFRMCSEQEEH